MTPETTRRVQALFTELVGTFFLTLVIVLSGGRDGGGMAYVAIGLTLASLIYAFDHISGAQFNPAVTVGMVVTGKMPPLAAVLYVITQTLGGVTGALVAYAISSPDNIEPFVPPKGVGAAWAVEFLYTFALVLVQQNAGAEKNAREPNSYFGIAVAFAALAGAKATGPLSGGCFNPAVGTGLDFAELLKLSSDGAKAHAGLGNLWIYWSAPIAGALVASAVKTYQNAPPPLLFLHEGLPPVVPLTEALGSFFLVLTACLTNEGLAVGAILLAMVYMGDHVCGADYNPAVTLGVALRMGVPPREWWKVALTIAAQFVGAAAAAFAAYGVQGSVSLPNAAVGSIRGITGAVLFEFLWTGLLVYVVCAVMTPTHGEDDPAALEERRGHSRSFQGLAIGFVVAGGIYCGGVKGGGSGGVFNPALGSSVALVQAAFRVPGGVAGQLWVYWVGPFAGSLLGAGLFRLLHRHTDPGLDGYDGMINDGGDEQPSFY